MKEDYQKILINGLAKGASEDEKQEMLSLFHEQEGEYQVKNELFQLFSDVSAPEMSSGQLDKMFARLWAVVQENKRPSAGKKRVLRMVSGIAAALVVGLLAGVLLTNPFKTFDPVYYAAHSPRGSVSEVILPDETVIFLNADSRIRYTMNGKKGQREVYLEGEAWFDVVKHGKKEFLVHTPFYDVRVTGTQFNVKAYESDNEIATTLEEGEVMITSGKGCNIAGEIRVKPGEQLIYNKGTNRLAMQEVNTKWFTSWKDNKLIFVNMSLDKLVVLLERKFGVDIVVTDRELLDLHFDGTIKNETIIEILDIIQKTLPIHYHISGQQIEITSK